jgi:hypothetical protein
VFLLTVTSCDKTLPTQCNCWRRSAEQLGVCRKKKQRVRKSELGLSSQRACVLVRMVANLSSVNPHGVLAARRLLHGCVFLGADTLAEQALILLPLIDKPAVIAAANAALASVPWNKMAVRAVRIVAEVRLLKRISNLNSRGVTPNSRMVAEMLVQEWPIHVPQPSVTQWLAKLPHELAVRRRWLVKFRRFWGVRFRQLGSRGHLSPVDQRRKVSSKKDCFRFTFLNRF